MIKNFNKNKMIFFLTSIVVFFLIYLLNLKTTVLLDDYNYMYIWKPDNYTKLISDPKISSLRDVFISQKNHYMHWGGRSIVHFLVQLFFLIGKPVFNVVNSFGYVILIYLMYLHANYGKKTNAGLFIFINVMLFLFMPVFGQVFLWITGAGNYLWGSVIILLNLLPYRIYIENGERIKDNFKNSVLIIPLGIIAGWTNENTAGAMILVVLLFMAYLKTSNRKIPTWNITGLISSIVGFIIMILAPGNFFRSSLTVDNTSFIKKVINRFMKISYNLVDKHVMIFFIVVIALVVASHFTKKNKSKVIMKSMIYFVSAVACSYAMVLSPEFPDRSYAGMIILIIISIGTLYANFDNSYVFIRSLKTATLTFLCIYSLFNFSKGYIDIKESYDFMVKRDAFVTAQKESGNLDLVLPIHEGESKYNANTSDLSEDKNYWLNKTLCRYYKVNSITGKKQ